MGDQRSWQHEQLEQELRATRSELDALQSLLDELPEIFERKFQSRLQPILEQQHRLLQDNAALRQQLLQLHPQTASPQQRPVLLPSIAAACGDQRTGLRATLRKILSRRGREAA